MKIAIIILLIIAFVGLVFLIRQSKKMLNATLKAEAELPKKAKPRQLHPELAKKQK